jgi:UrcA family protein
MALVLGFANVAPHKMRKELTVKYFKRAVVIAIAAGSLNTAQFAQASDTVSFKLKAFELETVAGREKLLIRMKSEAGAACLTQSYSFFQDRFACKEDLQTQWIDAIGNPALAAMMRKGKDSLASAAN